MDDASRAAEQALVLRCQLGDREAFEALVARCDAPLRYYVRRLIGNEAEAADVVQNVWLGVFKRIRTLDAPEAFRAWMYRIAHHQVVTVFRRTSSRRRAEQSFAEELDQEVDVPWHLFDASRLHAAIEQLDVLHKEVILLAYVAELSSAEIAATLAVPAGTVKSRLHYAKRQLRERLEGGTRG